MRHLLVFAMLLLPFAVHTEAEGSYVTDIAEKHELIAKRRPAKPDVKGAQKVVNRCKPDQIRIHNAMRLLGRGDVRLREDPNVHGRLALPRLGVLKANPDNQADPWVLLRLLALLRAGYPADTALKGEIGAWLESASPGRNHDWADVSLELLALHALVQRPDAALADLRETAHERAKSIAVGRDWLIADPAEPGLDTITGQLHFLLARRLIAANGWGDNPGIECAGKIVSRLSAALASDRRGELWLNIPAEQDSAYYRALMLIGALLGVAAGDEALEKGTHSKAEKGLKLVADRLPEDPESEDGWRCFKGDALVMALTAREDVGRRQLRTACKDTAEFTLGRCRHNFGLPRPHNSHIATQLRWVLCRSYTDPGMGRGVVELEDRDTAAALCMALIANSDGLCEVPAPPLDAAEAEAVFRALETLDLEDYYGYMLKTDLAIEAASKWLLGRQDPDAIFRGDAVGGLGAHGLAVHALLEAGVPRDHPQMKRAWREFVRLVDDMLPKVLRGKGQGMVPQGLGNYSCSIALMTWQSYYEPEIRESGMYDAGTYEDYHAARACLWPKIPEREQKLIAEISWRLSNAEGFGWSYELPEMNRPIPSPATIEPKRGNGKEDPTTGRAAEDEIPRGVRDERARRVREGKFPPRPATPADGGYHADNSNSQYSVLGLKAAMALGAPMDLKTLAWEAERLMNSCFGGHGYAERVLDPTRLMSLKELEARSRDPRYAPDDPNMIRQRAGLKPYPIGGWAYFAGGAHTWGQTKNPVVGTDKDGNPTFLWPYSVAMTAAGISSLAIIRDALMIAEVYDPQLIEKIDDYIAGGLHGLGLKYPYSREYFKIDVNQTECWIGGGDGRGMLYDMYSCERAGVTTGSVYFANVDWYRDGADLLMKEQGANGGWEALEADMCNPSWVILFLKRAAPYLSTTQPPDRPKQPPPAPDGPVTGK